MRLITICAMGAVLAATTASIGAAGSDKQGCPSGSDLMTVTRINLTITSAGNEQSLIDFDLAGNADGLLCVHLLPDAAAKHTPFSPLFMVSDNTVGNPNSVIVDIATPRP